MGKMPYYGGSDTEETSCSSSVDSVKKKKKKLSILKSKKSKPKEKKSKSYSKSESDHLEIRSNRSKSSQRGTFKLQGILKHNNYSHSDKIYSSPDEDEESDLDTLRPYPHSRYLVGSVPPLGSRPGRGGGVALIVRKNVNSLQGSEYSTRSTKKIKSSTRRLSRKKSY